MSINLTLEKPASKEAPPVQYTKRIDDLIEDAEIEAEIEAEQKIRAKNTKIVTISGLAVGLLVFLYFGIQSTSKTTEPTVQSPEIAKANLNAKPKPIPFPVNKDKTANVEAKMDAPETVAKTAANANLKPLPVAESKSAAPVKTAKPSPVKNEKASVTPPAPKKAKAEKEISKPSGSVGGTSLKALGLPPARTLKEPKATPKLSFGMSGPGYFVQVGAFSKKSGAQRIVERLKAAGFTSSLGTKTLQRNGAEKTVHTVKVGSFSSNQEAKQAQTSLAKAGFKNTFIFKSKAG